MTKKIRRSLLFSLKFSNTGKKAFLQRLWNAYKEILDYLINLGVERDKIPNYQDVKSCTLVSFLSAVYKACALEHSKGILKSYFSIKKKREKRGKATNKPTLKKVSLKLDIRVFKFEKGQNSFDFWLKIRDPENKKWLSYPIKNYEYAKEYFENWNLRPFIEILQKGGKWYVKLVFEKEVEIREEKPKGIDIGYKKLITTSDGEVYGAHIREIIEKQIEPKKQGSKNWKQKKHYLKTEINRVLKEVINGTFSPILEELKNLKRGKRKKWSKSVNRKFNHWTYSYVLKRIKELCDVAGVRYHTVPPSYTSRTCPGCGYQDKLNRFGDVFRCLQCSYTEDADIVGAKNILKRFTEELVVPLPARL